MTGAKHWRFPSPCRIFSGKILKNFTGDYKRHTVKSLLSMNRLKVCRGKTVRQKRQVNMLILLNIGKQNSEAAFENAISKKAKGFGSSRPTIDFISCSVFIHNEKFWLKSKGLLSHHSIEGSTCCWRPFCLGHRNEIFLQSIL